MPYEVEFHPVGDASRAGDAISIRYWDGAKYQIIIVDGGTDDAGDNLVEHIKNQYGEDVFISHVVSTHPDTDHACGLRAVLSNFTVGTVWVHGVWQHASEMLPYFENPQWTADGLSDEIRQNYPVIEALHDLAAAQGTDVREPFQGAQIGPFTVLSPARWSYLRLVPQFRKTPEADTNTLEADNMLLQGNAKKSWLAKAVQSLVSWVTEQWDVELLREDPVTAAENETSTILFGQFDGQNVLLTADAGVNALRWGMDWAETAGLNISGLNVVQVPHHGSRSNVSPSILDRLVGAALAPRDTARGVAIVSVPTDDSSHPRKMVVNAFRRRGYPVYKTQGIRLRYHSGDMPARDDESTAAPFDWFTQVEDYD